MTGCFVAPARRPTVVGFALNFPPVCLWQETRGDHQQKVNKPASHNTNRWRRGRGGAVRNNSRVFPRLDMCSTLYGAHSCTAAAVVKQPPSGGGVGAASV